MQKHQQSFAFVDVLSCLCLLTAVLKHASGFSASDFTTRRASNVHSFRSMKLTAGQVQANSKKAEVNIFDNFLKSVGIKLPAKETTSSKKQSIGKSLKEPKRLPTKKVIIIGSGMSGLASAKELMKSGCNDFLMVDSADGPGGRVRTDVVDGYLLDRGFQVFIDSYPEAKSLFDGDFSELKLKAFWPGALVHHK